MQALLDTSKVSESVKTATMQAASDILKTETNFGATFAEALSHYIPEPSLMAQLIADNITETTALTAETQRTGQPVCTQYLRDGDDGGRSNRDTPIRSAG